MTAPFSFRIRINERKQYPAVPNPDPGVKEHPPGIDIARVHTPRETVHPNRPPGETREGSLHHHPPAINHRPLALDRPRDTHLVPQPPEIWHRKTRYENPIRMTRVGLEPTTYGLTCHFGFRRLPSLLTYDSGRQFVVWTVPLPSPAQQLPMVRHPPSSLYTFHANYDMAWLGVGSSKRSPTLTGFTTPFRAGCS
jgi:hypothetical protein